MYIYVGRECVCIYICVWCAWAGDIHIYMKEGDINVYLPICIYIYVYICTYMYICTWGWEGRGGRGKKASERKGGGGGYRIRERKGRRGLKKESEMKENTRERK